MLYAGGPTSHSAGAFQHKHTLQLLTGIRRFLFPLVQSLTHICLLCTFLPHPHLFLFSLTHPVYYNLLQCLCINIWVCVCVFDPRFFQGCSSSSCIVGLRALAIGSLLWSGKVLRDSCGPDPVKDSSRSRCVMEKQQNTNTANYDPDQQTELQWRLYALKW